MTAINPLAKYAPSQLAVARDTYIAVRMFGLYERVATLAIITQIVESSLLGPISYGDQPGYFGAFQQSDAWVAPLLRNTPQDPRHSLAGGLALWLYGGYAPGTPGLLSKQWITQPLGITCQQVQQSNTPTAYTAKEADGNAIMAWLLTDPTTQQLKTGLGL